MDANQRFEAWWKEQPGYHLGPLPATTRALLMMAWLAAEAAAARGCAKIARKHCVHEDCAFSDLPYSHHDYPHDGIAHCVPEEAIRQQYGVTE